MGGLRSIPFSRKNSCECTSTGASRGRQRFESAVGDSSKNGVSSEPSFLHSRSDGIDGYPAVRHSPGP
eukprot:292227-Chlamydomonas_euryale.AAC.1